VIGVTINYRLGPLGFLCLPELAEEAGKTGNYGLYDQLTAIRWVKDNIAAFCGDPDQITVFGQSAGAMSIQLHCLSRMAEGLFQQAVMCSGSGVSRLMSYAPASKHYAFWHAVMKRSGCETLEAFRALAPEKLFAAWQTAKKEVKGGGAAAFPCRDGELIVGNGVDILRAGKHLRIPYMCGSTDEDFGAPMLFSLAKKWCVAQEKPSYLWMFDRRLPGGDRGAWHSSDLWYWFGTLDRCWRPMEQKDDDLSDQMTDYLTNFAKSGNPNGNGLPSWEAAKSGALRIGEGITGMGKVSQLKLWLNMLAGKSSGE
jgi:para-nitrobenzyl esterase